MIATGIVRRVDELGRIVIPKELRNTLNIKEGERLEIFTNDLGNVVLKKHSPFNENRPDLKGIVKLLSAYINKGLAITDTEYVVACKKELAHLAKRKLDNNYINFLFNKNSKYSKVGEISLIDNSILNDEEYILPLVYDGDVMGSIIIRADEISEVEMALVSFAAKVITYRL